MNPIREEKNKELISSYRDIFLQVGNENFFNLEIIKKIRKEYYELKELDIQHQKKYKD